MSSHAVNKILQAIAKAIDIPDSSYQIADERYKSLADWFGRPESRSCRYDPHLYPQGSFRLGTVNRPLDENGEYDLDMGCRLRQGISKATHTQKQLKELIGADLEAYRVTNKFNQPKEEKNRCWRLKYADRLKFHLDAVPSIPEEQRRRTLIKEAMVKAGSADGLAQRVSDKAGAITDKTAAMYAVLSPDWLISNSEGYALWFESRMEQAQPLLEKWAMEARAAKVDHLPAYRKKSPLQKCVQILKRHRDVMFKGKPECQPISVIITTLAAMAYTGQVELEDAMAGILERMDQFVQDAVPHVPNPVNPAEDFADKWDKTEYRHLNLRGNFEAWLKQACADFQALTDSLSPTALESTAKKTFDVTLEAGIAGEQVDINIKEAKKRALLEKAATISTGAKTGPAVVIGSVGIANVAHKFYGSSGHKQA